MGIFFKKNETKVRPGFYNRYENVGKSIAASSIIGVCAIPIAAGWGPLGKVTEHRTTDSITSTYGSDGTTQAARELMNGGAIKVYVYRMGTGGTKSTANLTDNASGSAVDVVQIDALYDGARAFTLTVRDKIGSTTQRELVVMEGAVVLEVIPFAKGEGEPDALVAAVAAQNSPYITATKLADGSGVLAAVAQSAMTPGTAPTVTNDSYSTAFAALEPYKYNVIALDTVKNDVQLLLAAHIDRAHEEGKLCMGVIGEPTSIAFDTRKINARAYNDEKIVYFGGGWYDATGKLNDGVNAIAYVAGLISSTASNRSIVHTVIDGATDVAEHLTNADYEDAVLSGVVMPSVSPDGAVWFDNGVNTLMTPAENQDAGWKKIKRTAIRFELLERVDRTVAPLVGKINCDTDGISIVIQSAQGVLNDMIAESKLYPGAYIKADPERPAESDSAWFNIYADDIDSMEKIYATYKFRFSVNS